jgi:primosomal protein N' (replication factor Y)
VTPEVLSGLVSVCIDRPLLSLDRPFTYRLPEGTGAGVGSLVSVPFHGRSVRGWILGPTDDVPGRVLDVRKVESQVRFFDETSLQLYRWVAERYVAPLAAVISRSHPPRVVSEETDEELRRGMPAPVVSSIAPDSAADALRRHRNHERLSDALSSGDGTFVLRPVPELEVASAVDSVAACLSGGRRAVVLVPEAEPLPATAKAILDAFGDRAISFLGGSKRSRYRTWLRIASGGSDVVVGSRSAVFAPVPGLGLVLVSRENHSGHREDRAPYYHAREVAVARCRLEGAVALISDVCPSTESSVLDAVEVSPATRSWVPVETVKPAPQGRAPRLQTLLREARSGFVFEPLKGAGIAQVCRACGEPAACSACGGPIRSERGSFLCTVCEAPGSCARCGSGDFGVRRGGLESVEDWVSRSAGVSVRVAGPDAPPTSAEEVSLGGVQAVKETGPLGLDLVAVLDADLSLRRAGLSAAESALAVWMQAVAWARPHGRAIVQTAQPSDPAIQALVAGNPSRFHRAELRRRAESGFPVGHPVFRIAGTAGLAEELSRLGPENLLSTSAGEEAICLVSVHPDDLRAFGDAIRDLAVGGRVTRVEAEPHL